MNPNPCTCPSYDCKVHPRPAPAQSTTLQARLRVKNAARAADQVRRGVITEAMLRNRPVRQFELKNTPEVLALAKEYGELAKKIKEIDALQGGAIYLPKGVRSERQEKCKEEKRELLARTVEIEHLLGIF